MFIQRDSHPSKMAYQVIKAFISEKVKEFEAFSNSLAEDEKDINILLKREEGSSLNFQRLKEKGT
jgi:hypothetical protein